MTMEKIFDIESGETIEIPLDNERVAALAKYQAQLDSEKAQMEKNAIAKQAILDRLGLTADEAALLLS